MMLGREVKDTGNTATVTKVKWKDHIHDFSIRRMINSR